MVRWDPLWEVNPENLANIELNARAHHGSSLTVLTAASISVYHVANSSAGTAASAAAMPFAMSSAVISSHTSEISQNGITVSMF